ncbi:MAG TPA: hypothetical protein VF458_12780 [Ktedonobacteraceae bacterium]
MVNEKNWSSSHEQASSPEPVRERKELLGWWYRLSSPAEDFSAPPNEAIPRSRLASILILITLVASIAFIPAALTSDDLHVVPPVSGMFIAGCLCIPLNRRGYVTFVGILIVGSLDAALIYSLLSYPHFTLTQNAVPIYDLFVLSDIIAISLLPINSIFFVSAYHSIFMLADIVLQPHTPDLQFLLTSTSYSLMIRPLTIQIVVAIITYLWVRNTLHALKRANQAEIIARLEHTLALQQMDLDEGIQQILATLVEAANGNVNVRAPLARQSVLWQVGVGLNTLLARLQRASQTERELQYMKEEIRRLLLHIHRAKGQQTPLWLSAGGTELDLLISELLGSILF